MSAVPSHTPSQPLRSWNEFFRYHGIWAPGIRTFRLLRFRTKALIVSVVLLLPALVLGAAFVHESQSQITFSTKERDGIAAMTHFAPVMRGTLEARAAARATLGGHDAASHYAAARQAVDKGLAAFEDHLKASGDPLGLSARVDTLKQAWAATPAPGSALPEDERPVFEPVAKASTLVLQGITDESNLVLDPDLDSLYTIMAVFINLPRASEDLAQIWGWGTYGVAKGGLDNADQYKRYAVWNARSGGGIDDALSGFERAFDANPELKERVRLDGLKSALAFQTDADVSSMVKRALEPAEVFNAGQAALRAYFGTFDSALPALDGLLAQRVAGLERRRNVNALVVLGALLLGAYLFACFAKVMDGGIEEIAAHLARMADGDLTRSPEPWGRDEAADLMRTLRRTQEAMRTIVSEVRQVADNIDVASREIANGSMDLSTRTERAAAELEQTAASLEQINATVANTSDRTQRASEMASTNAAAASSGGEAISRAVATMTDINSASQRIGDIIGTIDGIAFQTNILALNAAVEAARAGEQGRGFAVVAGEVRSLAQRSAEAAREIKALITDTVERVHAGSAVVTKAGQQMHSVVEGAGKISTIVAEISDATQQQTSGVRQVGSSVADLDRMTQENAALVEQTAAASDSLRQRASELVQAVARFRVEAA